MFLCLCIRTLNIIRMWQKYVLFTLLENKAIKHVYYWMIFKKKKKKNIPITNPSNIYGLLLTFFSPYLLYANNYLLHLSTFKIWIGKHIEQTWKYKKCINFWFRHIQTENSWKECNMLQIKKNCMLMPECKTILTVQTLRAVLWQKIYF